MVKFYLPDSAVAIALLSLLPHSCLRLVVRVAPVGYGGIVDT